MSCITGCVETTSTISCNPCPSSDTGCLEYLSTDCVQYLGTTQTTGFSFTQGDSVTTMFAKVSAATIATPTWNTIAFSNASASTYSAYTPTTALYPNGLVRCSGLAQISSTTAALIISNPFISSSTYYPATTKGFIAVYSSSNYLVTIAASTGVITVTNLAGTTSWQIILDFSKIFYDKNT